MMNHAILFSLNQHKITCSLVCLHLLHPMIVDCGVFYYLYT